MRLSNLGWLASLVLGAGFSADAATSSLGRPALVFTNGVCRLEADLRGGALGQFARTPDGINPLQWNLPKPGEDAVRGFGHFLCLDRWGPASDAEAAKGMPYHGEAASVVWQVQQDVVLNGTRWEGAMSARLPLAGLTVKRRVEMSRREAVVVVHEEITNENALGRLYNIVQHPTLGGPFLDTDTLVDCNGRRGFAQGGALPYPEEPSAYWPRAMTRDGASVDIRRLGADPEPDVVSYVIDDQLGWVTATSPTQGLVVGYAWKTLDYPWVSHWRDVRDGRPAARGLEFGSTGLHQPYPVLVKKGTIWERPLYEYLDAGQTVRKSYLMFLAAVPKDFAGVHAVSVVQGRVTLKERGARAREVALDAGNLRFP